MKLTINTDGGSLNNPGRAASAFLIYSEGKLIYKEGKYIGIASNNVAEYTALVNALAKVKALVHRGIISHLSSIICIADSELMVKQLNGLYKIKHADMRDLYMQVKMLESELGIAISYTHVLRAKNADADALVKKALEISGKTCSPAELGEDEAESKQHENGNDLEKDHLVNSAVSLRGIHHIAIICSDYEKSKDFYVNILGFNIVTETYREAKKSYKLDLQLPSGEKIELFSFPKTPKRVTDPEATGLRHLAFSVTNIDESIKQLQRHGIPAEVIRTDEVTGKRYTFFSDPDGLPLELYE